MSQQLATMAPKKTYIPSLEITTDTSAALPVFFFLMVLS